MKFLKSIFFVSVFLVGIAKSGDFLTIMREFKKELEAVKPINDSQHQFIDRCLTTIRYFKNKDVEKLIKEKTIKFDGSIFRTASRKYTFLIHPDKRPSYEKYGLADIWDKFKTDIAPHGAQIFDNKSVADLVNSSNKYIESLKEKNKLKEKPQDEAKIDSLKKIFIMTPRKSELIRNFYNFFSSVEKYLAEGINQLYSNEKINHIIFQFNITVDKDDNYKTLRSTEFVYQQMFDYLQKLSIKLEEGFSKDNELELLEELKKDFKSSTDNYLYFFSNIKKELFDVKYKFLHYERYYQWYKNNYQYSAEDIEEYKKCYYKLLELINTMNDFIDKNELLGKWFAFTKISSDAFQGINFESFQENLQENDKINAKILAMYKSIKKYNSFMDYEGIDCLFHRDEINMIEKVKNSKDIAEFKEYIEDLKDFYKKGINIVFVTSREKSETGINFIRMNYFITFILKEYYQEVWGENFKKEKRDPLDKLFDVLRVSLNGFFPDIFGDYAKSWSEVSLFDPFQENGPTFWYDEFGQAIESENKIKVPKNEENFAVSGDDINPDIYELLRKFFFIKDNFFDEESCDRADSLDGHYNSSIMDTLKKKIITEKAIKEFKVQGILQIQDLIKYKNDLCEKLEK